MLHQRQGFQTTAPMSSSDGVDRKRYRVLSDRLNAALCTSVKQVLEQFGVVELYKEDAARAELTELCERIMGQLFRTDYNRKHGPVFNGAKAVAAKSTPEWKQRLSRLSVDSTAPVINTRYLRGNGVVFYLYALVTSKSGENLPGVNAGYTKPVSKVPPSIASELPKPMLVSAEEAAARGELWYISVGTDKEGKGWVWGKKNGAREAAAVQEVLSFLLQFTGRKSVNGARAFYVEIANNFLGL